MGRGPALCAVLLLLAASIGVQGELLQYTRLAPAMTDSGRARRPRNPASGRLHRRLRPLCAAGAAQERGLKATVAAAGKVTVRRCKDLPLGSTAAFDQLMGQHDGSKCADFIKGVKDWNLKSEQGCGQPRVSVAPAPPRDRCPAAVRSFSCITRTYLNSVPCATPLRGRACPCMYRQPVGPAAGLLRSVSRGKIILCPTNAALQVGRH